MKPRSLTDFALQRRLLSEARPYWLLVLSVWLVSLVSIPLALLTPLPLKLVVDNVLGSKPLPGFVEALLPSSGSSSVLVFAIVLLIVVALLNQVQGGASSILKAYAGEKLVLRLRSRLFSRVQRLSLSYHDSKGTADSAYRIHYDAPGIQWVMLEAAVPLATSVFMLASMVYVIARISPQLTLVALATAPLIFLTASMYRPRLRRQHRLVKNLESSALSIVQEVLTSLRVVKAFGQEQREEDRFVQRGGEGVRARMGLTFLESRFGIIVGLITAIGTAAVLLIGVRNIQSGAMTLGDLLLVVGYLSQLYGPLNSAGKIAVGLQAHMASAERVFGILDETTDVEECPDARPLTRASGQVAFQNVSFCYAEGSPVLDGISFEVPPGSLVGVKGATGVGKTTLTNLLMRFYDPTSGEIALDGVDIRDYKLSDLRNQFALVLQDPVLFSASLAENIAYARPGASQDDIRAAAEAANIHEFIMSLPKGYKTQVGERGMRLSGGERQRISLARAFLKDAPILILDEPTSSVDLATESMIMESIERLTRDRTTFLITHRLTTLTNCDMVLVVENGSVRRESPRVAVRRAHGAGSVPRPAQDL